MFNVQLLSKPTLPLYPLQVGLSGDGQWSKQTLCLLSEQIIFFVFGSDGGSKIDGPMTYSVSQFSRL